MGYNARKYVEENHSLKTYEKFSEVCVEVMKSKRGVSVGK
jgi:hypothetical protein